MTPWITRLWRPLMLRELQKATGIMQIEVQNEGPVRDLIQSGAGVLVTPNHSFHYDSYVMIETGHRTGSPFHFLTAWQVFQMSGAFGRKMLQWHGCFSINREGNDVQAFKKSIEILKTSPHPLVIFPEGDIYHSNDRLTPFRDGAAAILLSAAKKAERPVYWVPCALKAYYVADPTAELTALANRLEASLHWRPRPHEPLHERLYRIAGGLLTLKELEYLGNPQTGALPERVRGLALAVVQRLEAKHSLPTKDALLPERVKEIRRTVIKGLEQEGLSPEQQTALRHDLEDLFFVIQLFSYPGDYVAEKPSLERIAETLDKFEEDVLKADLPQARGKRHVVVRFGEPVAGPTERDSRDAVAQWTHRMEAEVQQLLDQINANLPERRLA
jgi:hypothetical protein